MQMQLQQHAENLGEAGVTRSDPGQRKRKADKGRDREAEKIWASRWKDVPVPASIAPHVLRTRATYAVGAGVPGPQVLDKVRSHSAE